MSDRTARLLSALPYVLLAAWLAFAWHTAPAFDRDVALALARLSLRLFLPPLVVGLGCALAARPRRDKR